MSQQRIYKLPVVSEPSPAPDAPIDLSIVVPVFNEVPLLEELHVRLRTVCEELDRRYELIFVDDGSTDSSFQMLQKLKAQDPHIRIIRFTRNFGQQAAVLAAFRHSRGDVVVQIDSDLQNPPEEISKLLDALEENIDLVTTRPRKRQDTLLRNLGSRFLVWLGQTVSGNAFRATARNKVLSAARYSLGFSTGSNCRLNEFSSRSQALRRRITASLLARIRNR